MHTLSINNEWYQTRKMIDHELNISVKFIIWLIVDYYYMVIHLCYLIHRAFIDSLWIIHDLCSLMIWVHLVFATFLLDLILFPPIQYSFCGLSRITCRHKVRDILQDDVFCSLHIVTINWKTTFGFLLHKALFLSTAKIARFF